MIHHNRCIAYSLTEDDSAMGLRKKRCGVCMCVCVDQIDPVCWYVVCAIFCSSFASNLAEWQLSLVKETHSECTVVHQSLRKHTRSRYSALDHMARARKKEHITGMLIQSPHVITYEEDGPCRTGYCICLPEHPHIWDRTLRVVSEPCLAYLTPVHGST